MKILYLVPKEVYERKMSRVRFQQMAAIDRFLREGKHDQAENVGVVYAGPGWSGWDEGSSGADNVIRLLNAGSGEPPHLAVTYKVGGLRGSPLPVWTQYNEAFDVRGVRQFVEENGVQGVIFHHQNDLLRYPEWTRPGSIWVRHIPHCADPAVYRDYGLEKDIDVLVAGNMSQYYYPFRNRLRRLATQVLRKRGYRVVVLPHPGYQLPPKEGAVVGEAFARMLNRAKVAFTCSMRHNYALAKYSEIALCRTLPVGDIPGERQEFFQRTVLQVEPWMLDEEIQRTVEEVLDNPERLKKLTDEAYDLTLQHFSMGVYAELFVRAANVFLDARRAAHA